MSYWHGAQGEFANRARAGGRSAALAGSIALGFALFACSVIVDGNEPQCVADADCAARGTAFSGTVCRESLCVESAKGATSGDALDCGSPVSSNQPTVKYSFAAFLPTSGDGAAGAPFRVTACQQFDVECHAPVVGPLEVKPTVLTDYILPQGFNGYFQISNPATMPALYFLSRTLVADTVAWSPTVLSQDTVSRLASAAGATLSPNAGLIIAAVRDCAGNPIAGVTVSSSDGLSLRYYVVNDLPVLAATETTAQGVVGFANVPATTVVLSARTKAGKVLPPVSLRVNAGSISLVELRP
jgi:hypothetical protein